MMSTSTSVAGSDNGFHNINMNVNMNGGEDHNQSRKRNATEISAMASSMDDQVSRDTQDYSVTTERQQQLQQQHHHNHTNNSAGAAIPYAQQLDQHQPQQHQHHQQPQQQQPQQQQPQQAAARHQNSSSSSSSMVLGISDGRSRRLPCKARGMGDSHTTTTAFFDIPHDLKHGAVLACSHRLCANSGRRFRYCQVCEVPVAKRNFQKRHSHGLVPVGDPMLLASNMHRMGGNQQQQHGGNNGNIDYGRSGQNNDEEQHGRHRRSVSYDAADTLNQLCATSATSEDLKPEASSNSLHGNGLGHPGAPPQEKSPSISLSPKEYQWLALLHNRPSVHDTGGMEQWMTNIIDISERNAAASAAAAASASQSTLPPSSSEAHKTVSVAQALTTNKPEAYPAPSPGAHPDLLALAQTITVAHNAEAQAMEKARAAAAAADPASAMPSYESENNPSPTANSLDRSSMLSDGGNTTTHDQPQNELTPAELNASMFTRHVAPPAPAAAPGPTSAAALAALPAADRANMFRASGPATKPHPSKTLTFKDKLLASEAAVDSGDDSSATKLNDDRTPDTLADYVAKKAAAAIARAGAAKQMTDFCSGNSTSNSNAKESEADINDDDSQRSQTSSVATRPNIRRRRSVQDARQLMGLIKLSGLKENDYDDIF